MNGLLLLPMGAIIGISVGAGILVLLVIILIAWYISTFNKLQRLKNLVEEGWSTIDVQLKKRYDLIPNLVETVKGYAKHESETLERVIAARSGALTATGANEKVAADKQVSGALRSLFARVESYPELKANTQFLSLQNQLLSIENDLSQARKFYNGKCKAYNIKLEKFPSNLVAGMMKLEKRAYFELDSEEERKNVKVSF